MITKGRSSRPIHDFRENSIFGPQQVDLATYRLKITGLVDREVSLTYQEIIEGFSSHQKVVTLHCVEGWDVTILWNGVLLSDLLATGWRPIGSKNRHFLCGGWVHHDPTVGVSAIKANPVGLSDERPHATGQPWFSLSTGGGSQVRLQMDQVGHQGGTLRRLELPGVL